VIALLVVAFALQAGAQDGATQPNVQFGISVRPETVTVGSHFVVTARVRAPASASIAWPNAPDTSESLEIVSSRALEVADDTTAMEESARWRLAAWDTGAMVVSFDDAVLADTDGERRIPLEARVYVRSVLPADTSLHDPKPTRDIFPATTPWWRWALLGLLIAALVGLLLWWWVRRRRTRPPPKPVDALEFANREFARVERMGLIEAGERGRFVALMTEVVRDYLALRLGDAPTSLTSTELVAHLRTRAGLPVQRLASVLAEADLVKFARRPVTTERARELGGEARSIVRDVEQSTARTQPEKAA
jgi:hypothetical protein